jgi:hypothetical protein
VAFWNGFFGYGGQNRRAGVFIFFLRLENSSQSMSLFLPAQSRRVQGKFGFGIVSFSRPGEKQQESEEHYQDGHSHHESPALPVACNHIDRLDAGNV